MAESIRNLGNVTGTQHYASRCRGYAIDVVLCIDGAASMEDKTENQHKIVKVIKENTHKVYQDLQNYMVKTGRELAQLRGKLILFRDYLADGDNAMLQTDFFQIPQQLAEFEETVSSVHAVGGGDEPEDGLEALAYAMKSKWTTYEGAKKRQVIVVWTDAGTHELGYSKRSAYYPSGMPANLAVLEDWWDAMDDYAKRLIIYAPDTNYWNYISDNWEKVYHVASVAGDGLSEHDYSEILEMISSSI
jgi:hypothetical protein